MVDIIELISHLYISCKKPLRYLNCMALSKSQKNTPEQMQKDSNMCSNSSHSDSFWKLNCPNSKYIVYRNCTLRHKNQIIPLQGLSRRGSIKELKFPFGLNVL